MPAQSTETESYLLRLGLCNVPLRVNAVVNVFCHMAEGCELNVIFLFLIIRKESSRVNCKYLTW